MTKAIVMKKKFVRDFLQKQMQQKNLKTISTCTESTASLDCRM
jgi:hypothetical protein